MKIMEEQDIQFAQVESYGKDGITYTQILLEYLRKVMNLGAVEFHGGFWQKKIKKGGFIEEYYVQNSRDIFINSIYILYYTSWGNFKYTPGIDLKYQDKIEELKVQLDNEKEENKRVVIARELFRFLNADIVIANYFGEAEISI